MEEVEEVAEEVPEEEDKKVAEAAEDKMPNKLSRSLTKISQLCETEDLFDLNQKCCLIHQCSINGV